MNKIMYENPITGISIKKCVVQYNAKVIMPVKGYFASGEFGNSEHELIVGVGALQGVKDTAQYIKKIIKS